MNPRTPMLYSLIKLHKENKPIRPIISSNNSTTYKISQFLLKYLKEEIKFKPDHTIKNRNELLTDLDRIKLPDSYTLLSFDIVNLYTNIPTKESLKIIKQLITEKKGQNDETNMINNLFTFCFQQNFCNFNNTIYTYEEGLPMGSPLSGIIADIYMNKIENDLIINDNNPHKDKIIIWKRYVDDILVILNTEKKEIIQGLHTYINSINNKIKFTREIEENGKLNFLDLTIEKNKEQLQYEIYRKQTQTDGIIPFNSFHHSTQKMTAIHAYLHRAYNSNLQEDKKLKEINIIKQITNNNKFPTDTINKMITKYEYNKHLNNNTTLTQRTNSEKIKYRTIQYPGYISTKINTIFRKYNIKLAYKNNNTITKRLTNNKEPTPMMKKNGIYKLQCGTCRATYIGETGRALETRIKEHLTRDSSNFGRHIIFNDTHEFDKTKNASLIHNMEKGSLMELLESYEINKFKENHKDTECLNEQTQTNNRPLYLFLKQPYTPLIKKERDRQAIMAT